MKIKPSFLALWVLLPSALSLSTPSSSPKNSIVPSLLKPYSEIQKALAEDKPEPIPSLVKNLKNILKQKSLETSTPQEKDLVKELVSKESNLAESTDLASLRISFGNFSRPLVDYLKANKQESKGYQLFFCPMFPKGYAFWIQPDGEALANPYWGREMLTCGVKRPW